MEKSLFVQQTEKVYRILRGIETSQKKLSANEVLDNPLIRAFLELTPKNVEEEKLQKTLFHIKDGMPAEQLEFLLVPFERYLEKNLKDDDFIVLSSDKETRQKIFPVHIALENLRSSFNVGSFFRLADGLGIKHIHLCGYTPHPSKTAMGAETEVQYQQHIKSMDCIERLKQQGVRVIGVETTTKSLTHVEPYPLSQEICFFFGNERFGLNLETLRHCDEIRSIPMFGRKNSLNVAVAAGMILSEWIRQQSGFTNEN